MGQNPLFFELLEDITSYIQAIILAEEEAQIERSGGILLATSSTHDVWRGVMSWPRHIRFIQGTTRCRWKMIIHRQMALTLRGNSERRGYQGVVPSVTHHGTAL